MKIVTTLDFTRKLYAYTPMDSADYVNDHATYVWVEVNYNIFIHNGYWKLTE